MGPLTRASGADRELRLLGNICRDLSLPPVAREFTKRRREFISAIYATPPASITAEMDVSELQLDALDAKSVSEQTAVLCRAVELLRSTPEKEIPALVSVGAGIVRLLRAAGAAPDPKVVNAILAELPKLSNHHQRIFRGILEERFTIGDLKSAVAHLSHTSYQRDLAATIHPVMPMAIRALDVSCADGDSDMFLLSAAILSQPSLAAPPAPSAQNNAPNEWRQLLSSGVQDPEVLAEAYKRSRAEPADLSLASLGELSVAELSSSLYDGEEALVFAANDHDETFTLKIDPTGTSKPKKTPESQWSPRAFKMWRTQFPKPYAEWEPVTEPFLTERLTSDEAYATVQQLRIPESDGNLPLVLFPSAKVLGFVHNFFLNTDDQPLLARRPVAIAPSPGWLRNVRLQPRLPSGRRVAWFGSKAGSDMRLAYLRDKLEPTLLSENFEVLNDDAPEAVEADIAIVVSHGGVGTSGFFQAITDYRSEFSPAAFAQLFSGCGCVVLLMCHAASSNVKHLSADSHSLVVDLLRKNVRTVVACPWPLTLDTAREWLPAFLKPLSLGHSVAISAWTAARVVRQKIPHPCGWAALHVYGDGAFALSVQTSHKSILNSTDSHGSQ